MAIGILQAHGTVECAFGILVSKWRCLKSQLQVSHENVDKLVSAACLLHNLILGREGTDEATLQRTRSSDTAEYEASAIRGPSATIERREKLTTFVNDSKFILTEKGPLISVTIKSTPTSDEIN